MQQLIMWVNSILNARGKDEQGTSAVEYALLLILIAALIVTAGSTLGSSVAQVVKDMASCITWP